MQDKSFDKSLPNIIPEPGQTGVEFRKGGTDMNNINKCIECTVSQCANHSSAGNYCAHECDPKQDQCTDCMSFRKK